ANGAAAGRYGRWFYYEHFNLYIITMRNLKLVATCLFLGFYIVSGAQGGRILTFGEFMHGVRERNIGYSAEKYGVDMARADAEASRVFPDPELSVDYANNQDWSLRMGYSVEASLGYTVELGGKRRARIDAARSRMEMTEAAVEDYFRNLRADASIAWFTALKSAKDCAIRRSSYLRMLEVAAADSIRYRSGDISETDARQSRLEAGGMLNEAYAAEGAMRDAVVELVWLAGLDAAPDSVAGDILYVRRDFDLGRLIEIALDNRADVRAALKAEEVSRHNLRVAKAARVTDLGVSAGAVYSSKALNEIAPAPAFTGLMAGVSIPLRLSNRNRGDLNAARAATLRSSTEREAAKARTSAEVRQAYNRYVVACRQVEQYGAGLLDDAASILRSKTYAYRRGESGLLELLNAERTYNDVHMNYNETLYNYATALVELERACGIWDENES
ncbi:MAG: TolC family protein, partial [Tannerellaceae bacterium]|nr:TolC family protein [Tannerellaceae bacterium]